MLPYRFGIIFSCYVTVIYPLSFDIPEFFDPLNTYDPE
jgi:hypothetical protein